MNNTDEYRSLMAMPQNIVITTHQNPDADALGSSLAISRYLAKQGHQVQVITPTEYPQFLDWLPKNNEVLIYNEKNKEKCEDLIKNAGVIFCLDFSSYNRLDKLTELVKSSSAKIVLIDHHLNPNVIADFEIWNPEASATTELVYQFIAEMGNINDIDVSIAEGIYAGLVTDTLSFKLGTTTPNAHKIAAHLLEIGLNASRIHQLIYDNVKIEKLKFLGYVLQNKLVYLPEKNTAYFVITAEEFESFGMGLGDTEGLVNYALSLKDIVLAGIIIERPEYIKISLRSNGDFPVNELAKKYFEGGGHKNAAGANCQGTLEEVEQKFLEAIKNYEKQLTTQ
jgi:phosphoesterase RecJ-like protein